MRLKLEGRGLFVFSDPGGAKSILALSESLKPHLVSYKIVSDRTFVFTSDFNVDVHKPTGSAFDEIKNYNPDFVFTATSYTSSIELEYVKAARELSIPSYSFIDHWTSIRERFTSNGVEIFPDKILIIDEHAKKIAVSQGIDQDKLVIFGNPYHQYLQEWTPSISKEDLLQSLGLHDNTKKIVLFAPEPISNLNGKSVYGFDEISATKELLTALKEVTNEFRFVCKLHPNQNPDYLIPVIKEKMIVAPPDVNVNSLIYYSDIVLGFFSGLLVEAMVMNKPVIRFYVKKGLKDPFENIGVGKIAYPETIVQELKMIE